MHLHDITDPMRELEHDLSLFDERDTYTMCFSCGAMTDRHGISVERDRSCDLCAGEV